MAMRMSFGYWGICLPPSQPRHVSTPTPIAWAAAACVRPCLARHALISAISMRKIIVDINRIVNHNEVMTRKMQIFVDMDGVLANFDAGYEREFGIKPCKIKDNVDWKAVRKVRGFYENLPPMDDMLELWGHIEKYQPIVLTGVPSSVEEAPENKRAWVRKNLGEHVEVRCCASKDKALHAIPGDILIDDWKKYQHLWELKGGIWITHTSAENSISELKAMGI